MKTTIPEKALVALPDFENPESGKFTIVAPNEARVPAFDRSFHFGDSIYEVFRTYEGVPFGLTEHLDRLDQSAKLALFEKPVDRDLVLQMIRETCRAYFTKFGANPGKDEVYVRITISRGVSDLNIDRRGASSPYPLIFVKHISNFSQKQYDEGVHYAIVERRRNHRMALDPAMKSGNYLNSILALREATDLGAEDAIMLDLQGFVTEGTTNNVSMIKDGQVFVPPLSVGILAGITRDFMLDLCAKNKIPVTEGLNTAQDFMSADEVFLSSSTKEIMPISKLTYMGTTKVIAGGKAGPITQKIHRLVRDYIQECTKANRHLCLYP